MVKVELTMVRAQDALGRVSLSAGQVLRARVVSVGEDLVELEFPGFRLMARSLVPLPLGRQVTLLVKESNAERVVLQLQEEETEEKPAAGPGRQGNVPQRTDLQPGNGVRESTRVREEGTGAWGSTGVRHASPRAGAEPGHPSPLEEGEGASTGGARELAPSAAVPAGAWVLHIPGGREERPFQVRMRNGRRGNRSGEEEVSLFLEVETRRLDLVGVHLAAWGPRLAVHFQVASQPVREWLEAKLVELAVALEALQFELGGLSCAVRTLPAGRVEMRRGGLDTRV